MLKSSVRDSAEYIVKLSKHVTINEAGVRSLAEKLIVQLKANKKYIHFKSWGEHMLNPKVANKLAVQWIFLVDALNFSFWSIDQSSKFMVKYKGEKYTGYWSLCAAINRALDEGIPVIGAEYCKTITLEQAQILFRSDSSENIPMLNERVAVMNEIGNILLEKFNGDFSECVKEAKLDAQQLLKMITQNFPCFSDEGIFEGKHVTFYKRAQILIADIWACFEGQGLGYFENIDSITMFADYRIPQALVYFKVLEYSEELNKLLEQNHMFKTGDRMEMEIRGGSIWAVELVTYEMRKLLLEDEEMKNVRINAILLDHYLWDYRRVHDAQTKHIPFHKIRCIYY